MSETEKRFLGELRKTFIRGSVLIIPVALTYWFFRALLNAIDGILSPLFEDFIGHPVPGLGFAAMIVLVIIIGLLSRNLVGRVLLAWFEKLLGSVPFVRGVYGAIKDLIGAFTSGRQGQNISSGRAHRVSAAGSLHDCVCHKRDEIHIVQREVTGVR